MKSLNKIKVVEFIPRLTVGGAENVLKTICKKIDYKKFELIVISLYDLPNDTWPVGPNYYYLGKNKKGFNFQALKKLISLLGSKRPDVIHNHFFHLFIYLIPANILSCRAPIAQTIHNTLRHSSLEYLWRIFFEVFKITPVNLSANLNPIIQRIGKSTVIANSVDLKRFKFMNKRRNKKILFIGRFEKQKNPILALKFLAKVCDKDKEYSMTMIGQGSLDKKILKTAHMLEIRKKIKIINGSVDPLPFYRTHAFFLITSDWEGMPLVAIEAVATGLKIFSTKAGAVPSVVSGSGHIFPSRDPSEMANFFIKNCEEKFKNSSENFKQKFSEETMVKKYEKLFLTLYE